MGRQKVSACCNTLSCKSMQARQSVYRTCSRDKKVTAEFQCNSVHLGKYHHAAAVTCMLVVEHQTGKLVMRRAVRDE